MEIVIPETAVAEVGGIRVAVGNIWEEEFELDSKQVTASRATLYVMGDTPDTDFDVRVHVGHTVQIGAETVVVSHIHDPDAAPGSLTLTVQQAHVEHSNTPEPIGELSQDSEWLTVLSSPVRTAHSDWVYAGFQGPGRIVVENKNLREALLSKSNMSGARFVGCDLTEVQMGRIYADKIELINCALEGMNAPSIRLRDGLLEQCGCDEATLDLAYMDRATLLDSSFQRCLMRRSTWAGARVERCNFTGSSFFEASIEDAVFIECQFKDAILSWDGEPENFGRAHNTRFVGCDFRGAKLEGLRLKGTIFEACAFYGVQGRPTIEGPFTIIDADMSPEFDGSQVTQGESLLVDWDSTED